MLWIQYEATGKVTMDFIQDVIHEICACISPYPAAAFDEGEFGLGLVACEGRYVDKESIRTSFTSDSPVSEVGMVSNFHGTAEASGATSLTMWGTALQLVETRGSTTDTLQTSDAENVESGQKEDCNSNELPIANTQHISGSENGNPSEQPHNHEYNENAGHYQREESERVSGIGDSQLSSDIHIEESDVVHTQEPPADPPTSVLSRKSGTYWGRTNIYVERDGRRSCLQELDISFDVQIEPTKWRDGQIDCQVSLDRVGVKVSPVLSNGEDQDKISPAWYLVTRKVHIQIGPHGGHCLDLAQWPVQSSFVQQHIVSKTRTHQVLLELSSKPRALWKGEGEISNAKSLLPVTVGVKPDYIGCGPTAAGVKWAYSVLEPFQTRLELSERVPPMHGAVMRVDSSNAEDIPESFGVCVEAIYRRKIGVAWKRMVSRLPPKLRFFDDLKVSYVQVILDARIKRIGDDWFSFPTEEKGGCSLSMDMVFPLRAPLNGLPTKIGGSQGAIALLTGSERRLSVSSE
jgi:hypothetical protein